MGPVDWVAVVSRWAHIGTAIVLVGGTVFTLFVLMPAAAALPEAEHDALRRRVRDRWRMWVHIGIALFLLSGLYNYSLQIPHHKGDGLYHGLIGTKILMALVIFALAELLAGKTAAADRIRRNARRWLVVVVTLAALIVAISGFLRVRGSAVTAPPPASASAS